MAKFIARFGFVGAAILIALLSGAAVGSGTQRSFVASYGLSTNTVLNCSLANPSRQLSDALSVTGVGGEVVILDSAGYGIATIAQSVSIVAAPGVYAGV